MAPTPIWLGDYPSMDDDVRIEDVAKRLDVAIKEKLASGDLDNPFDMIVHSTGGLIVRSWLAQYFPEGKSSPLKRLIMLAPANFGSKLASTGKSMLGRLTKGWDNWFHTGTEMLNALELASPYQWNLAQHDLFGLGSPIYREKGVWPFVIMGSHPYTSAIRRIVNENGSDGTIRVSAANLNVRGITVDFAANEGDPRLTPWPFRDPSLRIPFAVLPNRSHGSIIDQSAPDTKVAPLPDGDVGDLILAALRANDFSAYQSLATSWAALTDQTATRNDPDPEYFHQYFQVIVRVVDDHGNDVTDYFVEFFDRTINGEDETVLLHRKVIEDVHTNKISPSYRCFFVDYTDLINLYYETDFGGKRPTEVVMSLSAAPPGKNVQYFEDSAKGALGQIVVHSKDGAKGFFTPNQTHLVKIIIPRNPHSNVFRFVSQP